MTTLIYGGGEVGSHRVLLEGMGVTNIAVNYSRAASRGLPTTKLYADRLAPETRVFLYPGKVAGDVDVFAAEYLAFAKANLAALDAVMEVDLGDPSKQMAFRASLVSEIGEERAWITWEPGAGSLDSLAQRFQHIVLKGDDIESDASLPGRMTALYGLYGTFWHATAFAKPDEIKRLPLESVIIHAWLAPMLRGETIVWENTKLHRYSQQHKDTARTRAAHIAESAGLDAALIQSDDHNEVAKLAIWSYQQLEKTLVTLALIAPRVTQMAPEDDPGSAETQAGAVAQRGVPMRNVIEPAPHEKSVLPIVGLRLQDDVETAPGGDKTIVERAYLDSQKSTIRQCDTCIVRGNCPGFEPQSSCKFELPVEVKTKDQLRSFITSLIEIQGMRVLFGRFAEELNGGYPDENVSKEMDRFMRMVKTTKELEDNREFIKITAERSSGAGVLSAIFGDRASALRELPNGGIGEEQATKMLEQVPGAL